MPEDWKPREVELTGRLHKPSKWAPQLEIFPAGQISRIDLWCAGLDKLKDGTPLHVRGVIQTRLHAGGTDEDPSPFAPQWIIGVHVTDLEVVEDLAAFLREKRVGQGK